MVAVDADEAVTNLERLLAAIETSQGVSAELLSLVRAQRERLDELTEDIAGIGLRVAELERERRNENSLRVVGRERFRTLDELAAVLRDEFAAEVEAITQRIDSVHERALRALTNLSTKGTNA